MENTVLSIDIGTTSLKAALTAEDAERGLVVCASSRVDFRAEDKSKAAIEWMAALKIAILEMREKTKAPTDFQDPFSRLSGVCISGNGPTIVSKDGTTLLWNEKIDENVSVDTKSLFIPRLLQFRRQFAYSWNHSDTIFSGPEYLIFRLTNRAVTILPEFRYISAYWDTHALYHAGFSALEQSKFPAFRSPGDCAGAVSADAAIALDGMLPAGLPVFCGAPDFVSALIGTATIFAGRILDRAGSSEGINLCTKNPLFAPEIRTLPSVISGLWNAGVLIDESGVLLSRHKEKIEKKIGKVLSWSDFFDGIFSDKDEEGKSILVKQAKESAAAVKKLFFAAKSSGLPVDTKILVAGGQALNEQWMQLKCDEIGLPLFVPALPDAELTGDAVLARFGLGEYESITDAAEALVRPAKQYFPRKQEHL